jgi:hypothetical protein
VCASGSGRGYTVRARSSLGRPTEARNLAGLENIVRTTRASSTQWNRGSPYPEVGCLHRDAPNVERLRPAAGWSPEERDQLNELERQLTLEDPELDAATV